MTATPTRPTPDQIQRILDVVAAGLDVDDAIDSVWADMPAPKAPAKPTVMVTEFPDGVVIGWDFCSSLNAGCGKTVAQCACKNGPRELKVFSEWRTGSKTMPDYGKAANAAARQGVATTDVIGKGNVGVVVAVQPKKGAVHPDGQVVCREHNDFVDQTEADKNDDGTWTCFLCQEAGVQVQRD